MSLPLQTGAHALRGRSPEWLLLIEAALVGVLGGLAAQVLMALIELAKKLFLELIAGYREPKLPSERGALVMHITRSYGLWLVPLSLVIGGLISGLLITYVARESKGHGTDKAIRSFHRTAGFERYRVPPNTLLSASALIGSGGSAGREGPIISIAGGIGSIFGTLAGRPKPERALLLMMGMSAGLAAVYRAPVGAAIFSIEALYTSMELESGALLYTLIAAVVAWLTNALFWGWAPLIRFPSHLPAPSFGDYGWFALLGIAAGLLSSVYPAIFYWVRDHFDAVPAPLWIKPAVGGLMTGLVAVLFPQVLSGGYGWMQLSIFGHIGVWLLVALVFAKLATLAFSVGSGGTGGVFAPSLFIGGMLGGAIAHAFGQATVAPFVVAGMAAVFGASCRAPLTATVMICEMTRSWRFLPAVALAVWVSFLVQDRLSRRFRYVSLYEAQVPGRSDSPTHFAEHIERALAVVARIPREHADEDVAKLVRRGVSAELPAGWAVSTREIDAASRFVGETLAAAEEAATTSGRWKAIAVVRGDRVLLPHPEAVLAAGDRVVVLTGAGEGAVPILG